MFILGKDAAMPRRSCPELNLLLITVLFPCLPDLRLRYKTPLLRVLSPTGLPSTQEQSNVSYNGPDRLRFRQLSPVFSITGKLINMTL